MRSLVLITLTVRLAFAQEFAPTGSVKFEVATIKPTPPGAPGAPLRPAPGGRRYAGAGTTLWAYLWVAYQVKPDQIAGGPGWMRTDLFDMTGEAEKPSTIEDLQIMLQNLLTERFKLRFHFEKKEMPAYILTVDKGGPRNMTTHEASDGGQIGVEPATQGLVHAKWKVKSATMSRFAWNLSNGTLDKPVIDQTGLKGEYDFGLSFTMDLPPGVKDGQIFNGEVIDAFGPTILEALQKQLGLKLEAKRAPVETMVIDHAERPGEN